MRVVFGSLITCLLSTASLAGDLTTGEYRIRYWLELPHLERYSQVRETIACYVPGGALPIMSGNGAFSSCQLRSLVERHGKLRYTLACAEKAGARAEALYRTGSTFFSGRVAVKLGAKNMTLTEVQSGERIGHCRTVDFAE